MSKIADAIIVFMDEYDAAEREYHYHEALMLDHDVGYMRGEHAVQALLAYAKMYGLANTSDEMLGDKSLQDRFAKEFLSEESDFNKEKGS